MTLQLRTMLLRLFALVGCCFVLLANCQAAGQNPAKIKPAPPSASKTALVTVYWPGLYLNLGIFGEKLTFYVDDKAVKEIEVGDTFTISLPYGPHKMRYERRFTMLNSSNIPILIKNPRHYFKVYHFQKINDWEEVSESVGKADLAKMK
jgi:hypothetical protein